MFCRNGVYPLTAYDTNGQNPVPITAFSNDVRALSPDRKNVDGAPTETHKSSVTQSGDKEHRRVINMMCNVKPKENNGETELSVCIRIDIFIHKQQFFFTDLSLFIFS